MPSSNYCTWHTTGKPQWWPGRFFQAGCRECERRAALDPTLRSEKTPEQCFDAWKAQRRTEGQRAGVAARRRKARAAMTADYLAQPAPGRAA